MKKLIFIAAAVAAMAACTKSQVVYDDTENEIGIMPVSDKATKALYGPVKDAVYPEGESFGVFAQHSTAAAGETFATGSGELNDYLVNVEFVYDNTTASDADGKKWHGKTPYYWPKTGSLYFAGYSPYSITAGTRDYDFTRTAPKLTIADFVQGAYNYKDGSATAPGGNASDSYQMVDLLWFDATASSANTGAPAVIFKHALSYITIKLDVSTGLDNLFYLKSVKLSDIEMKARGIPFLPRQVKTEIRERVIADLGRDALPSFGSVDCVIDLREGRLFASALAESAVSSLAPAFRETTGCMPVMMLPESAALRRLGIDVNMLEPCLISPNPELAVPSGITLGTDFLTWLYWFWEKGAATFEMDGETCGERGGTREEDGAMEVVGQLGDALGKELRGQLGVAVRGRRAVLGKEERGHVALHDDDLCGKARIVHAAEFAFEAFPARRDGAHEVVKGLTLDGEGLVAFQCVIPLREGAPLGLRQLRREGPGGLFAGVDDNLHGLGAKGLAGAAKGFAGEVAVLFAAGASGAPPPAMARMMPSATFFSIFRMPPWPK